ncbi:MAG TPA: SRPBCC family protein [Acidimicrobiales bacterium]|nr:SRPBCC family protein [Acidimicrobiales bacterium]
MTENTVVGNVGREASVVVRADAGVVWSMVTDVTRMGEWSPETVRAEWIDGATGPAVGARFKGENRKGRTRWSTTCEVIESEPGRSFAFAVGKVAKPETVWRYRFEPVAEGVKVTESFELTKPLGFGSRLVTRLTTGVKDRPADMEEGVRATLAALKRVAEGETSRRAGS